MVFLDLFEMFDVNLEEPSKEVESATSTFDPSLYLKKGEKITSLKRERKVRIPNCETKKGIISLLKPGDENLSVDELKKRLTRRVQNTLDGLESGELPEFAKQFERYVPVIQSTYRQELIAYCCKIKEDDVRAFRIEYNEKSEYAVSYDSVKKRRGRGVRFEGEPGPYLYLYTLSEYLVELGLREMVYDCVSHTVKEEDVNSPVWQTVYNYLCNFAGRADGVVKISSQLYEEDKGGCEEFMELLDKFRIPNFVAGGTTGCVCYLTSDLYVLLGKEVGASRLFNCSWLNSDILRCIVSEYVEEEKARKYEKEMGDEARATSYITKKNIPEKVVRAMESSGFNNYFGYVEFDELTDLEKILELEKEFRALEEVLPIIKRENVALRFRRLGHHKAGGLYYYNIGCLCVDLGQPSSMVHEYFHMLDYETDELSRQAAFQEIRDRYSYLMKKIASSKESGGVFKGKYNLDYYLTPSEIFARCGEMYLRRFLNVSNSLLGDCTGFAYPMDEELENLIVDYYSAWLNIKVDRLSVG